MPYKITKSKGGYTVSSPHRKFSKKPLPKKKALAQLAAIKMNTNESFGLRVDAILETLEESWGKNLAIAGVLGAATLGGMGIHHASQKIVNRITQPQEISRPADVAMGFSIKVDGNKAVVTYKPSISDEMAHEKAMQRLGDGWTLKTTGENAGGRFGVKTMEFERS